MALGGKRVKMATKLVETPTFEVKPSNQQENIEGIVEDRPVITQVAKRKSIVDTEYVPVSHLIIHTQGDTLTINYYRQLVGLDDPLRSLQQGTLPVHQQYEKIQRYEIKVDSPLVPSQDQTTKEFTLTGEAGVTFGLIPNKGDMFVADKGGGEAGLFTLTNSVRMTDMKQATYQIQYELVADLDEKWEEELESKVVKTVVFEKNMIELYDSPFMTESAHNTYISLNEHDRRIAAYFMQAFWSKSVQSIKLPGQEFDVYDGFHADFCKHIGLGDILKPIDMYKYGMTDIEDVISLWELFKEMDLYKMQLVHKSFGELPSVSFEGVHVQRGIAWSAYELAVFPKGEFYDIDGTRRHAVANVDISEAVNEKGAVTLSDALQKSTGLVGRPLYYPVTFEPYVLSEAFYKGDRPNMSVLEIQLHRALSDEATNPNVVAVLCEEIYTEPHLSQYYYIPLLLVLIHASRRGGE